MKQIKDYPNYYITKDGNVWSEKNKRFLKANINKGYFYVVLSNLNVKKTFEIHKLLAITYLNHIPCGYKIVVDHINNIKTDNRVENLQLISPRENTSKDRKNGSSKYTGVYWDKINKNWRSTIRINGKLKYLGRFKNEIEASNAYQNVLNNI